MWQVKTRQALKNALRTGTVSIVADGQVMECWYAQWCATGITCSGKAVCTTSIGGARLATIRHIRSMAEQ